MIKRVSAREARSRFAEITDRVRYTGEPVIVSKQGQPFVAVVSLDDLDALERLHREDGMREFTRLSARAARETGVEPSEMEVVEALRQTREALYRERYGGS